MSLTDPKHVYPVLKATRITNPNRFYAFPLLGFIVKVFMLIPQAIELLVLAIAAFFVVVIINPFVVLFTGKYWDSAYKLSVGMMKLVTKIYFFLFGLTNKYPGFDFDIHDDFNVDIPKPEHPNRLFAIPVLGGLARIIMLIPFMIYENVIRNAASAGATGSSFVVLFKGNYPESTFEIERDSVRLTLAQAMYLNGLSDSYPNFWISMNHQTVKIVLIIIGALMFLNTIQTNMRNMMTPKPSYDRNMYYNNIQQQQDIEKQMQQYNQRYNNQPQ